MSRIIAYPRIHFGLADMGQASKRAFGGAGVLIKALPSVIETKSSDAFSLTIHGAKDEHLRKSILSSVENARRLNLNTDCKIGVDITIPRHSGLGSGTQIVLSVLKCIAAEKRWGITNQKLFEISGRSKTSSVGSATNMYGGFCVDLGCENEVGSSVQYSSEMSEKPRGLILGSWTFPKDWVCSIFCYDLGSSLSGDEEDEFFRENYPASRESALETIAALFMGMIPSVITQDYDGFRESLRIIQDTGFKKISVSRNSEKVKSLLRELWDNGFAAGVSSFGPTVFAIHSKKATDFMLNLAKKENSIGQFGVEIISKPEEVQK